MFSTTSSTSGGISLPRASTIKRKTPLIITQSGRVAKRRHRSFNNALKTTEDDDAFLKKQTTRKDEDGGNAFFSREKVLETKATAMCLSALLVMMSFPNASFDAVEAMEISSNKETTTRTTTLRTTTNREKGTQDKLFDDFVLPPPSLSSSLSSLSSSDDAGRAMTTNAGRWAR